MSELCLQQQTEEAALSDGSLVGRQSRDNECIVVAVPRAVAGDAAGRSSAACLTEEQKGGRLVHNRGRPQRLRERETLSGNYRGECRHLCAGRSFCCIRLLLGK